MSATEEYDLPAGSYPLWIIGKPDLIRTLQFAAHAHRLQRRKYTFEPYIFHPISVATRLQSFYKSEFGVSAPTVLLQAALLHDTVEDTDASFGDIAVNFGMDVATLVFWLTDLPMPNSSRKVRKQLNAERLRNAPDAALIVKHFDLQDNTESIEKYDPAFAATYLPEKARIREYTEVALTHADYYLRFPFHSSVREL